MMAKCGACETYEGHIDRLIAEKNQLAQHIRELEALVIEKDQVIDQRQAMLEERDPRDLTPDYYRWARNRLKEAGLGHLNIQAGIGSLIAEVERLSKWIEEESAGWGRFAVEFGNWLNALVETGKKAQAVMEKYKGE
jgi:hypothetical protein